MMEHVFVQKNPKAPTLLLLHGTGGDEHSLMEIGNYLAPNSSLLGLRGTVTEQGANRYFKRVAEGVFDLESVAEASDLLATTVTELAALYQFKLTELVVVGYSNGANIGGHLLLTHQLGIKTGILLHPMSLGDLRQIPDLAATSVWLSYGANDSLVPKASFTSLLKLFERSGAKTTTYEFTGGHGLSETELSQAKRWLEEVASDDSLS